MIVSALSVMASVVQTQLKSVRVFPGGPFAQYIGFVNTCAYYPVGIAIYPERVFVGVGPTRRLEFSDSTVKLDPPMIPQLQFVRKGILGSLNQEFCLSIIVVSTIWLQ